MRKTSQKTPNKTSTRKAGATFVAAWIPDEVVAAMDREVLKTDSDRSKLIRKAIRQHLSRP